MSLQENYASIHISLKWGLQAGLGSTMPSPPSSELPQFSRRKRKLGASGKSLVRGPGTPEATRLWLIHLVSALLPAPENCSPGGILNIHLIYSSLPTAL